MQDALRCQVISFAAVAKASALRQQVFSLPVAPRQISAIAEKPEIPGRQDFPFAAPSIALSIAAGKMAHSFSVRQKALGQIPPAPGRTARQQ